MIKWYARVILAVLSLYSAVAMEHAFLGHHEETSNACEESSSHYCQDHAHGDLCDLCAVMHIDHSFLKPVCCTKARITSELHNQLSAAEALIYHDENARTNKGPPSVV